MQNFRNGPIRKEKEQNYIQNKRLVTHYKNKERKDMQKRLSSNIKKKNVSNNQFIKRLLNYFIQ